MNYEELGKVLSENRAVVSIHAIETIEEALLILERFSDERPEISVQPTAFAVRVETQHCDVTVFVAR
jgi:hypothetical protein